MARVQPYERVVDAVLTNTSPALDTENGVKIKEEPTDMPSISEETGDTLVRHCFSLIDHDYHRDESSLLKNDILCKNVNSTENKQSSNSHSNDVNKTNNVETSKVERKNLKTKKEIDNTLIPLKKQKCSNEISNDKNADVSRTIKTRKKRKLRYTTVSKKNKRYYSNECDICFRKFFSTKNCIAHKQCYALEKDNTCRFCKQHYATQEEWQSHTCMPREHSVKSYRFHCNFCSRTFKSKEFLQSHLFHIHTELICFSNTIKHDTSRSEIVNTSLNDTLRTNANKESLCLINFVKLEKISTVLTNDINKSCDDNVTNTEKSRINKSSTNEISPANKRLRQPTLTEYLKLCKKKRDNKVSPNKLNVMEDDFPTCASHHDEKIRGNSRPKLPEGHNEQIDSLPAKSGDLPKQKACPTLEQSVKQEKCKKPFVKLYADVEIMKSFLESLSDTVVKKRTEGRISDTVSYDRGIPYRLRSLGETSYVEADSNSTMRKNKNVSTKTRFNIEFSTKGEQNVIDSDKVDSELRARFKCKKCTISLTRCDEQPTNSHQISTIDVTINALLPTDVTTNALLSTEDNLSQESDVQNTTTLKDLEVSLERLTATPDIKTTDTKESDIEKHNYNYFFCKICDMTFTSKLAKRLHIKSTHVAYMSSICDSRYSQRHKLLQHYLREHLFEQNKCCICYTLLSDYKELKQHLNMHCLKYIQRPDDQYSVDVELNCSLAINAYKCLQCNKTFSSQSSLVDHQSCCAIKKENQEDFREEASAHPDSLEMQQKNTEENIVTRDERINPGDSREPLNNDCIEKSNEHQVSLLEKEPKTNEVEQNVPVNNNLLIEEKLGTVNESQDSKKLLEDNNSTISNQNIANTQSDDVTGKTTTYPCDICGKQFQTPKNLEIHKRTFNFTTDVCPMCGTRFSSKRLLQTHITAAHVPQISKTYSFHCVFCNQGFIKKHDLRPHILHLHGQQMLNALTRNPIMSDEAIHAHTATCNTCNLVFETHDRYVEHRMYYYKNHAFKCKFCEQNFQGMYMLNHHNKLTHYSEDLRKSYSYICDICKEGFNHESHFYSHRMHVHSYACSNEANLTETTKENSRLDYSSNTQEQIRNVSTEQKQMQQKQNKQPSNEYVCQVCQLKCIDMNHMTKHIEHYSNNGNFRCDKCQRRCRTFTLLEQHKKLTHYCRDIYNGHACHICGEVLETIIALKCHEKHFHLNITSNDTDNRKNCSQRSPSNITHKITEHPPESKTISNTEQYSIALYNCVFCNMKFSTANSVQTHIVHVHMDDMIAKRAALKLSLPIIDNDDIQKRLIEINQASSSSVSSSSVSSSSEDKLTELLRRTTTQQSNNIVNNMARTGINNKTTIELKKLKAIRIPKNNKIKKKEKTPIIPPIPCTSKSNQDNIFIFTASNTKSKADTSVSPSTGPFRYVVPSAEFGNNSSNPLSTGSTTFTIPSAKFGNNSSVSSVTGSRIFKTVVPNTKSKDNTSVPLSGSTNNFQRCDAVSSKAGSINEFKANLVSSLNRSVIVENKSKTAPAYLLSTVSSSATKNVTPQSWKSNEITNQKYESRNSYNYNCNYPCPLCPLEYPSLMFFHAHLKYAHADSIRTDELNMPQMNQVQKTSTIECLLCPCSFTDEITYKKHLRNSHMYFVYISNSEQTAKNNNVCNPPVTQTNINRGSTVPETITLDDDDDNVKTAPEPLTTKVTTTLDYKRQNDKIGKLRVKPFAKIIENLSKDSALNFL